MQKNKVKVIAGIVLVFLLGILVGSLGTGIYAKRKFESFVMGGPLKKRVLAMKRLSDKLDLTPEQQAGIGKIVDKAMNDLHEHRQKHHPTIKGIMDNAFSSIKEKLRDDQKGQMDRLYDRLKKRWQEKRGHHKRPHKDRRREREMRGEEK